MASHPFDRNGEARGPVPRVLGALGPLAAMLAFACTTACSPFHQVQDVTDLGAGEKVVLGEVRVVNGDLAEWVGGIYVWSAIVLDYQVPVHYGRVMVEVGDGNVVAHAPFDRHGGWFSAGVKNQDVIVLGITVHSTYVLAGMDTVYPVLVSIKPSSNRCEYVGTLLVSRHGHEISTVVEDRYDEFVASHPSAVSGCALGKNLGVALLRRRPGAE